MRFALLLPTAALLAAVFGSLPACAGAPDGLQIQGRVTVQGAPFTGTGQFRFALLDDADQILWTSAPDSSPADGVPDTATSLAVTRGLYGVQLGTETAPLPADLFSTQNPRRLRVWFDDGTHGAQLLTPDQPLAAVAYARHSATAEKSAEAVSISGTVPAAQVQGKLAPGNLPEIVARLDSSPTFAGTVHAASFDGAGAVPWIPTDVTDLRARANTGYLATRDDAPLRVELPSDAQAGDVVRVSGTGTGGWIVQVRPGDALIGGNLGLDWTAREEVRAWRKVIVSPDGRSLIAAAENTPLLFSSDAGETWSSRGTNLTWSSLTASTNATRLVAAEAGGWLWVSSDAGLTWSPRATQSLWQQVASSADGMEVVATDASNRIWESHDGGETWSFTTQQFVNPISAGVASDGSFRIVGTQSGPSLGSSLAQPAWHLIQLFTTGLPLRAIGLSAGAERLAVAEEGGFLYLSSDLGNQWDIRGPMKNWSALAAANDGLRWVAAARGDAIWLSEDSGNSWYPTALTGQWSSAACSADGRTLAVAEDGGRIHVSTQSLHGDADSIAEFQCLRPGQWRVSRQSLLHRDGTLDAAVIPGLPASRITQGILSVDRLPELPADRTTSGVFDPARIPLLPASRIASGIFDLARLPSLPASQIDSGTLSVDRIPGLPASQITSGTLAPARVPGLPATQINSGTLEVARIPDLSAAKITTGTFDPDRIPSLPATKIASGTLNPARIPELSATQITSGTFDSARLPTTIGSDRSFTGRVGIGGLDPLGATLGVRADNANPGVGYCLSLHNRNNAPVWKVGIDNNGVFSLGASGLRDYDLSLSAASGNAAFGGTPVSNRKLRVVGDFSATGAVYASGVELVSDQRFKTNVVALADSLDRIEALRGVAFDWREGIPDHPAMPGRQLGFLAQELAGVLPELVHTNTDGTLSANYLGVTPVLVEAVKDLRARHDARLAEKDAQIADLRARLDRLEATIAARNELKPAARE